MALYKNGVQVPGAVAYTTGTAGDPVAVSISATIRQGCRCDGADSLTVVLVEGAGTVENVAVRVIKE